MLVLVGCTQGACHQAWARWNRLARALFSRTNFARPLLQTAGSHGGSVYTMEVGVSYGQGHSSEACFSM